MTTLTLSQRARLLKPSPTLAIGAKAKALKAAGKDVIAFSVGEPDFNTPDTICDAAAKALRDGQTKYGPSAGLPALREAIARKLTEQNHFPAEPSEIVVSCGAKHCVYNALQILCDAGDEVILIAPFWSTYNEQVLLSGAQPRIVHAHSENGCIPALEDIAAAIQPNTKAIILNSPNNPTGAVFPPDLIRQIVTLCAERGLWIISDEIYEHLVYEGTHASPAALVPEARDQIITINGCSKTYSMTGWRIGFTHAPKRVAAAISDLQDQVTSNPTTFAQYGAIAALNMPLDLVHAMRDTFRGRRDTMLHHLAQIPNCTTPNPAGAFYCFPDITAHLPEGWDDVRLATHLLDEAFVACVPGSVFEAPGHLRLSYATNEDEIIRGVARIAEVLQNLPKP